MTSSKQNSLQAQDKIAISKTHFVNGNSCLPPYPDHLSKAMFGLGCFWGAEKVFWQLHGVYVTSVGYAAGHTDNPNYKEVCTGKTGHNEVVLVVFNSEIIPYSTLLNTFWESHNPTQGMRQGYDVGTQYRSGIYCFTREQYDTAKHSKENYQKLIRDAGYADITTEILPAPKFYFAEDYHQQYLAKNLEGYCGLGGLGISCSTKPKVKLR